MSFDGVVGWTVLFLLSTKFQLFVVDTRFGQASWIMLFAYHFDMLACHVLCMMLKIDIWSMLVMVSGNMHIGGGGIQQQFCVV